MGTSSAMGRSMTFIDKLTFDDFRKTLECPICLEVVVSPVINCTSGHIICSLCRPKVDKCGLCGGNYTTIRNYPVEAILAMIEVQCRHALCQASMKADKLRDHLDTCDFRPISCHEYCVAKCTGQQISFEDYPRHLMEVHKTRCKTSDDPEFQRINLSNALEVKWPIFLLSHRNQTFFLHRKSIFHHLMCWVSMMAPEREAVNNVFRLRIQHPYDLRKYMEWSVRANSIHSSLDGIKEAGNCVFIPYEALIPYCERKVVHTTGQVFEYKWIMKILIERDIVKVPSTTSGSDPNTDTSIPLEVEEGTEIYEDGGGTGT